LIEVSSLDLGSENTNADVELRTIQLVNTCSSVPDITLNGVPFTTNLPSAELNVNVGVSIADAGVL